MGLIRGEGRLLKEKYMKKYHIGQREAISMVEKFVDELDSIKTKLKAKQKSDIEIKQAQQKRFEEEFMKLCCED